MRGVNLFYYENQQKILYKKGLYPNFRQRPMSDIAY